MTAGNGIIHQEMPRGEKDGLLWGFQLWANLPASSKMIEPRYRDVKSGTIPEVTMDDGTRIKIICGDVNGTKGPVRDIVIDPEYLDITVQPKTVFKHPFRNGHTVLAYVIEGTGYFDAGRDSYAYEVQGANYFDLNRECLIQSESLVIFNDGDEVMISTADSAVRFILISGMPIGEPVAWYGPIVMNTQEELKTAFEEYRSGTFIKHKK